MASDPSERLQRAAFEYENLLLKAGDLVRPDGINVNGSPHAKIHYSFTEPLQQAPVSNYEDDDGDFEIMHPSDKFKNELPERIHRQRPMLQHESKDMFTLMDTLREEVSRLKSALAEANAGSISEQQIQAEKMNKMREEIFHLRVTYDAQIDNLQAENAELKSALNKVHKELAIERRELLKCASMLERKGIRQGGNQ